MVRPADGQELGTTHVRIYHETHKMLRDIARCRSVTGGVPAPTDAEIVEDLLETAFRCFEEHGADYAKPYKAREALSRAKKIAGSIDRLSKRKRGQRGPDRKPRRRRDSA